MLYKEAKPYRKKIDFTRSLQHTHIYIYTFFFGVLVCNARLHVFN